MKVVFILPNLGSGGAERVVTILSEAMVEKKIDVDIVLFLSDTVQYQIPDGVNVVRMNTRELSKAERIKKLRNYFKLQRKMAGRIVVVPFQDNCLKYALAAAAGLGIPVIACERNDPYQKGRSGMAKVKANLPYALARKCVFQTPDARDYYWKCIRKKGTVIVNPLRLSTDFKWKGQQSRKIISVGRLEPQKNQRLLIDAFAQIHKEYSEYTLEIYGEGALRPQLQAQIDNLGLSDAVFLKGYAADIHQKLENAEMFVLPSDYEGMSNALIEALAIGIPVITTDHPIGGARILIENEVNGLMTPVGDADALKKAVQRLIAEPELARKLGAGGIHVREKLAPEKVLKQWLDVLKM